MKKHKINKEILKYINRLSDYLFVLARQTNKTEVLWKPLKNNLNCIMPIKNRISKFENEITQWRHYFHENPELAYKEKNTSKKVVELLKNL